MATDAEPAPQAPEGRVRAPRAGSLRALLSAPAGRALVTVTGAMLVGTVVALIALWPEPDPQDRSGALGGATIAATAQRVEIVPCGPVGQDCRRVVAVVGEGADAGRRVTLDLGPVDASQDVRAGQRIRVTRSAGAPPGSPPYGFTDVDRRTPLLWLFVAFAAFGVVVARRQGALALLGLAASIALVATFLVPAMLEGTSPVLVSFVAALAVMFVTLLLTYGVSAQSLAAAAGIGACLLLAAVLGDLALGFTDVDGRGGELYPLLQQAGVGGLSLEGIVLAGMVIGALGVLTDTAVTQASAVVALRRANARLGVRGLYQGAFRVGRDHLAATMHTLVMVYVGTLLPLLLVLEAADVPLLDAVNGQFLAEPAVAMLVGSIALMASVPLTTFLAALLAVRVPASALPETHAHAH
ncbi:MAG: YibE/F family protein [Solirubrobacteraceae bacterium]|nr:YibE/F family protein [Solirubrobacteraceae bacterium]